MADLETAIGVYPSYPYNIQMIGPPTLVSEYEDGTETIRKKSSVTKILITARYAVDRPTMKKITDYYVTKGTDTSFTIVAHHTSDATWGTTTTSVRFAQEPSYDQIGPAPASGGLGYVATLVFKQVV